MPIGERVKNARKRRKLTMQEVADAAGLTQSTVSRIESGTSEPERKTIAALAKVLNDNFGLEWLDEYLTGDEGAPSKKEIVEDMSVKEFLSLKFGGKRSHRTSREAEMLAQLLDAEIKRMEEEGW